MSIVISCCGGCAVGRDVDPSTVGAHPHTAESRGGGDADIGLLAGRGVQDRDVATVLDVRPAGVDVPPVRADHQVGDVELDRVGRDDRFESVSKARIRVVRRRHAADVGTITGHRDGGRFVDVGDGQPGTAPFAVSISETLSSP